MHHMFCTCFYEFLWMARISLFAVENQILPKRPTFMICAGFFIFFYFLFCFCFYFCFLCGTFIFFCFCFVCLGFLRSGGLCALFPQPAILSSLSSLSRQACRLKKMEKIETIHSIWKYTKQNLNEAFWQHWNFGRTLSCGPDVFISLLFVSVIYNREGTQNNIRVYKIVQPLRSYLITVIATFIMRSYMSNINIQ